MEILIARSRDDWNLAHPELLLPPFAILRVPLGGPAQAVLERHPRRPPDEAGGFRTIRRVTEHLTGPLADVGDQARRGAHHAHDHAGDLGNAEALSGADVDDFAAQRR